MFVWERKSASAVVADSAFAVAAETHRRPRSDVCDSQLRASWMSCTVFCIMSVFGAPISDSESKLASSRSKSSSLVPFFNIFCVEGTSFVLGEHESRCFQ